ncbi:MAG: hypothetical protein KatS3mg076_1663 [Candidatus Binatia bacterium]|nr:MAG: hypothetical protein KatS3mg076_1663 [Candidatus Binatia bacterium]
MFTSSVVLKAKARVSEPPAFVCTRTLPSVSQFASATL